MVWNRVNLGEHERWIGGKWGVKEGKIGGCDYLENMCMDPPCPLQHPVFFPNSSAITSLAGTPFDRACTWSRYVLYRYCWIREGFLGQLVGRWGEVWGIVKGGMRWGGEREDLDGERGKEGGKLRGSWLYLVTKSSFLRYLMNPLETASCPLYKCTNPNILPL